MTADLLERSNCVGVCTDRACSVSVIHGGLQASICQKSPCAMRTHCMIHEQALTSKNLSPELEEVLQTVTKVKYVKTRPSKPRMYARLCKEIGAEHISSNFL